MLGNVFILGDSYSTFEGFLPDSYAAYYKKAGRPETDVTSVKETWWYGVLSETKSTLVRNCSWSGTTICNTGYSGRDCSDNSFIARFDKLADEGFFSENKIDTFFLFGGTSAPTSALASDISSASPFCSAPTPCRRKKQALS